MWLRATSRRLLEALMKDAPMAATLASIAVGAVLGAWSRYVLSVAFNGSGALDWGTLAANGIGALLIGVALGFFQAHPELSPLWRAALVTGFLGALTTFSAFSAESLTLLQQARFGMALAHTVTHVLGSLVLAALGYWLATR
jgi:fluoride exporter